MAFQKPHPTRLQSPSACAKHHAMHKHPIRVYYEDTDLAGIVYYANYLKFIERGRTEALRAVGVDQMALKSREGMVFAVRHVAADFLAPARMDDMLTVTTRLTELKGVRIQLLQEVLRDETLLFRADVTIVALREDGKPARIPQPITLSLQQIGD